MKMPKYRCPTCDYPLDSEGVPITADYDVAMQALRDNPGMPRYVVACCEQRYIVERHTAAGKYVGRSISDFATAEQAENVAETFREVHKHLTDVFTVKEIKE